MSEKSDSGNPVVRRMAARALAALFWLGVAALGGTFVFGCFQFGGNTSLTTPPGPTLAIAMNGHIKLYTGLASLANSGPAPTTTQSLSAPNVLGVAFDMQRNLYYLSNNGTAGSDATFHVCTLPTAGMPYPSCTAVGAPIPGGQWLTIDTSGTVFATSLTNATGTVVSFPAASGPPTSPTVVYTSGTLPYAYGGIAIDGSGTLYVTEQPAAAHFPNDQVYRCTSVCQSSSGSQIDVTAAVVGTHTTSVVDGPLAIAQDGQTLLVGVANINNHPPVTSPVAFVCTPNGGGGFTCQDDTVTFPPVFGADNPFVLTLGIAGGAGGDVYLAVQLDDGGQTGGNFGPGFYGFQASGALFGCSGTPSTCPVNQLPSLPVNTATGSMSYALAVVP